VTVPAGLYKSLLWSLLHRWIFTTGGGKDASDKYHKNKNQKFLNGLGAREKIGKGKQTATPDRTDAPGQSFSGRPGRFCLIG